MPHFLNGGAPDYTGFQFNSEASLLNAIKSNLEAAGWIVEADQISTSRKLRMKGSDNGHFCWVTFSTINDATETFGKRLIMEGDLLGDESKKSPQLYFSFIDTASNLLWITADAGSGCIGIRSYSGEIRSGHFGYLDRPDPALDEFGWMVGYLHVLQKEAYFAKLFNYPADEWRSPFSTSNYAGFGMFTNGTFDRYTTATWGRLQAITDSPLDPVSAGNAEFNPARFNYQGQVNGVDNKPILGDYFYQQGSSSGNYKTTAEAWNEGLKVPAKIYFRGSVKYAVVGLASVSAGVHVTLSSGERYLSGGGRQWQGFRIV